MSTRVRIAPSPTGNLHIGTARAALFNFLFARHTGGKFVVRIEDTDLERSDQKFEKNILEGLAWLGIEADESPIIGGPFAPYRQTERIGLYKRYIMRLLADGKAFYCFHTEEELGKEKESLLAAKRSPLHFCEFRTMDPKEAATLAETNPNHVIRFKTPVGRTISFHDLIRGDLSFEADLLGDFSIAKRSDVPLYHLAVVVDDETMDITHVIRGEDHIANTIKHLLLIEAFGFRLPIYAHLPLVLGPDRSKLSKRHGATSINEYREQGYLPKALFNFLALLGWNPGDEREILSPDELIKEFSLEKVQKSGAIFDFAKLDWMNGEYIRKESAEELFLLAKPYLEDFLKFSIPNAKFSIEYIKKILVLEQPRLKKLSELTEKIDYFFKTPEYDTSLLHWKNISDEEVKKSLEHTLELLAQQKNIPIAELKEVFLNEGKTMGDRGILLWPLRVSLSGKKSSPDPFEIIEILGITETIGRIQIALQKFVN